jgi:hypothetical protein
MYMLAEGPDTTSTRARPPGTEERVAQKSQGGQNVGSEGRYLPVQRRGKAGKQCQNSEVLAEGPVTTSTRARPPAKPRAAKGKQEDRHPSLCPSPTVSQRFPTPDMLHEPPLPALHVPAASRVCYMDIFAKQQWHCPPGSSQVNLISCDPPRWFAPPTPG